MQTEVINHIGVSGGKDSTALLLWAVYESGYPRETIRVSFCNTGNEAPETLEYLDFLRENVFPIEEITPELGFYDLAAKRRRFPSSTARFCTTDLKVKPTKDHLDRLIATGADVVLHSGIRRAESRQRNTQTEEFVHDPFFDCTVRRPLLNWTIQDVWDIHARYGIPRNPLYDMGMTRVGCYPCVMCRKEEIGRIALKDPARIAFLRRMEQMVALASPRGEATFFPPSKVPMRFRSKEWVRTGEGRARKKDDEVDTSPSLFEEDDEIERSLEAEDQPEKKYVFRLATIDDVAAWGLNNPDLYQEDLDADEVEELARSCPSAVGFCE